MKAGVNYLTILFFLQLTFLSFTAAPQTGSIRGRVYNQKNNEPLPFTNIIIFGTNIGSTTDLDGNFIFTGLEPGFLRLQVSAVGFERRVTEEFQVTNARTANIDIPMREIDLQQQGYIARNPILAWGRVYALFP